MNGIVRYRRHVLFVVCLALAFSGGFATSRIFPEVDDRIAIREYDERYAFIRPLLICQLNEGNETDEFGRLEKKIEGILNAAKADGKLSSASVYFRNLDSGEWMGVNELDPHAPASLLKVPIMMAYLKESENSPSVLDERYPYEKTSGGSGLSKVPLLVPGHSYSVREIIRGMIIQSDNEAKEILERNANTSVLEETYSILGINDPYGGKDGIYEISAKQYSLFFRVLYNGTYLDRERSNEALELMTESEYEYGLRAGTPSGVKIAHKFGLRIEEESAVQVELSDCGIVYYPSSPYLLCAMTEGKNPYELGSVIEEIAKTTYHEMTVRTK